jgi:hypothetical protein
MTAASTQVLDELEALASLQSFPVDSHELPDVTPEISGRTLPANVAREDAPEPVHPRDLPKFTPAHRSACAAYALPRLSEGDSLRALAAELGVSHVWLRDCLLVQDAAAYRAALAAQVAANLGHYADEGAAALDDIRRAVQLIDDEHMLVTGDGPKGTQYTLKGAELAKAGRLRAAAALDGSKHWQFLAERRLPHLFGKDRDAGSGKPAASFVFIINGETRGPKGRTIEGAGKLVDTVAPPERADS